MMEEVRTSEMLAYVNNTMRRYIPESCYLNIKAAAMVMLLKKNYYLHKSNYLYTTQHIYHNLYVKSYLRLHNIKCYFVLIRQRQVRIILILLFVIQHYCILIFIKYFVTLSKKYISRYYLDLFVILIGRFSS
jgi:hypothetical protein